MKLTDFVVTDAIVPALAAQYRDEALAELVRTLIHAEVIAPEHETALVETLVQREQSGSTGFGHGVGVPHAKHEAVDHMVAAIGISPGGVDFQSLDDAAVHTIILLLSPTDQPNEHLHAMETLFSNLQNESFRRSLRQAATVEEIIEIISQTDTQRMSAYPAAQHRGGR